MGAGLSKRSGHGEVERRHSWAAQQNAPKLLYKSFGGSFNQLQCFVHEFGSNHKCRSEDYLKQKGHGAMVGLHSDWIGNVVLACARPTDRIINEHHLLQQFHSKNIGAVINLEEPGEHAGCGDGVIAETGFAYNPDMFTQDNIAYFNFPWRGKNYMDEKLALCICQTMASRIAVREKVAVHCHSGIGRTGLVVAFYFLYSGKYEAPMAAVKAVRRERPGTLKSSSQEQLVKRFDSYLRKLRVQFVPPKQRRKNLTHGAIKPFPTITESMVRQNELLYGMEKQALHYVPKVLDWLTRELISRTEFDRAKREQIAMTFMEAFTTNLSLSPADELVQRAKVKINNGDWTGGGRLETSVLCHLLLEWLYQLQEPIVPEPIITTALGRGDIESSIDELSKCDQCSFASLQCLVCWMFQMVPVQPKLIRRLYSALGYVLLANTTLQHDQCSPYSSRSEDDRPPVPGAASSNLNPWVKPARRQSGNRMYDVYTKYKPSLLEIEFGLLLEASARFWIKLGAARHEEIEKGKRTVDSSPLGDSSSSSPSPTSFAAVALKLRDKHHMGSFSQPWFRDRASLQYQQYNPGNAMEYKREMERGSIGAPSPSPSPPTRVGEQKRKPEIQAAEQPQRTVRLEEKGKGKSRLGTVEEVKKAEGEGVKKTPIDHQEKKGPVAQGEKKTTGAQDEKKKAAAQEEKKKAAAQEEKRRAIAQEEKKQSVAFEEKKKAAAHEEKKKAVAHEEKKKPIANEEKRQPEATQVKRKLPSSEEKTKAALQEEKAAKKGVQRKPH